MRGNSFCRSALLAGVLALVAGVPPLAAADALPLPADQEKKGKVEKADQLEAMAMEILSLGDMDTWEQAAELLEKAARLRPKDEFARLETLKLAGNLFHWIGATEHARVLLQEAADGAWEMGKLAFAAHTYLDVAVVSAALKMGRHTVAATQKAERIADMPEMAQDDRLAVETRLDLLGLPRHVSEIM
jgi:hypothetical protein